MQFGSEYRVIGVLGTGGFGTVFRARFQGDGGFTKDVALKALNPHLEGVADIAARLRDEARMLGLLRHRAIVHVDRLLFVDGRWVVVMEYVEGVDLAALLRVGPIPVGPALEIVAEVAGALHAAWSRPGEDGRPLHLMHRDIKPSNLQITSYGEVKILDFGIARAEFDGREGVTRSVAFGSVDYMAPERLVPGGGGPKSDVYALGAVLVELLLGRPFGRGSLDPAKHAAQVERALAPLRDELGVDPRVVALVAELLAAEPEARPGADAVERRALELSRQVPGEPLRFWAERAVGPLLASRAQALGADPTTPVLEEAPARTATWPGVTPESVPESALGQPPVAPPRPWWQIALPALLVGAALGAVFGWSLSLHLDPPDGDPGPLPAPLAAPPAPVSAEVPAPEAPADPAVAPPAEAPAEAPSPASADRGPRARPALARVQVQGDAELVELRDGARTVALPGSVPPGDYQIFAKFSSLSMMGAGSLHLDAAATVTLRCDATFKKCVVLP